MLWYPQDPTQIRLVVDWITDRLDDGEDFADGYPVAVVEPLDDGDAIIKAAMVFTNWTGKNVFIAGASEANGWISRRDVAGVLNTPFRPPMSVLRVTALVEETNKRSARLMEAFGFVQEGVLRDYSAPGRKTLVYGLTKSDFLGGRYGRQISARAEPGKYDAAAGHEPACGAVRERVRSPGIYAVPDGGSGGDQGGQLRLRARAG